MSKSKINIVEMINKSVSAVMARPSFFVKVAAVFTIFTSLASMISYFLLGNNPENPKTANYSLLLGIMGNLIWLSMLIGIIKIALKTLENEIADIKTLFDSGDCFLRGVIGGIIYTCLFLFYILIVMVFVRIANLDQNILNILLILALIPTIVTALRYRFWLYFVIDKNLKPTQALRASERATRPILLDLFKFELICLILNIIGMLFFIVGFFITLPITILAKTIFYKKLLNCTDLTDFGVKTEKDSSKEVQ